MNAEKKHWVAVWLFAGVLLIGLTVLPGCNTAEPKREAVTMAEPAAQTARPVEQTICPVMGGKIDRDIYTEYKGQKVYFCCAGCEKMFLASPEKYVSKLPQFAK